MFSRLTAKYLDFRWPRFSLFTNITSIYKKKTLSSLSLLFSFPHFFSVYLLVLDLPFILRLLFLPFCQIPLRLFKKIFKKKKKRDLERERERERKEIGPMTTKNTSENFKHLPR